MKDPDCKFNVNPTQSQSDVRYQSALFNADVNLITVAEAIKMQELKIEIFRIFFLLRSLKFKYHVSNACSIQNFSRMHKILQFEN
jgi:hypothetical protein